MIKTKKKKIVLISIIAIILLIFIVATIIIFYPNKKEKQIKYVMHASGGYEDKTYLNSQESFEYNLNQGNTLFEIDFIYSKDGKIVCSHEFENVGNYSLTNPPTYEEFNSSLIYGKYHPLTIDYLVNKVKENPNVIIIFDSKNEDKLQIFDELYNLFRNKGLNTKKNFIAQVYSYDNFQALRDYEVKEFWFTNYKVKYTQNQINSYFSKEKKITTIVMSHSVYTNFVNEGLVIEKDIAIHGVRIYLTKENTKDIDVEYAFVHE